LGSSEADCFLFVVMVVVVVVVVVVVAAVGVVSGEVTMNRLCDIAGGCVSVGG